MPIGRPRRRLPDSLTQHLTDPKIVAFKPRDRKLTQRQGSERAKQIGLSAVTLIIVVLASGHLLRAW